MRRRSLPPITHRCRRGSVQSTHMHTTHQRISTHTQHTHLPRCQHVLPHPVASDCFIGISTVTSSRNPLKRANTTTVIIQSFNQQLPPPTCATDPSCFWHAGHASQPSSANQPTVKRCGKRERRTRGAKSDEMPTSEQLSRDQWHPLLTHGSAHTITETATLPPATRTPARCRLLKAHPGKPSL